MDGDGSVGSPPSFWGFREWVLSCSWQVPTYTFARFGLIDVWSVVGSPHAFCHHLGTGQPYEAGSDVSELSN